MAGKEVTENRDKYIGGSDIPIIMGLSPFKTRYQLLLEKAHLKDVEVVDNPAIDYGNEMEPIIRNYLNIATDEHFTVDTFALPGEPELVKDGELGIRINADGYDEENRFLLEIKTTSRIHESVDEYKLYLVQLLFGMMWFDTDYGYLAVYHRPEDYSTEFDDSRLQLFKVSLTDYDELEDEIEEAILRFKDDFKRIQSNPFLTEEDLLPTELVKMSYKVINLENRIKQIKFLQDRQKELNEELYKLMEANGVKKWETPNGVKITLIEPINDKKEMKFDEDAFKESHPELYNQYLKETIKKGRKGYIKVAL